MILSVYISNFRLVDAEKVRLYNIRNFKNASICPEQLKIIDFASCKAIGRLLRNVDR